MSRYIDAEKLCEFARNHINKSVDCNDIMRFPTADVQEVRHGRWDIFNNKIAQCSVCRYGRAIATQFWWNFCPACGAKVEEEEQK